MHALLATAIEQTGQQIAALESGDDDLFLERAPAHEAACLLAAGLPAEVVADEAAALVTRIEANARMDGAIAARQHRAAHRMAARAASRQANSAPPMALPPPLRLTPPTRPDCGARHRGHVPDTRSLSSPTPNPRTGSQVSRPGDDS